jgi:hypothetical protein
MKTRKPFSKDIILLEKVEVVTSEITIKLQQDVLHNFKRNGRVGIRASTHQSAWPFQ